MSLHSAANSRVWSLFSCGPGTDIFGNRLEIFENARHAIANDWDIPETFSVAMKIKVVYTCINNDNEFSEFYITSTKFNLLPCRTSPVMWDAWTVYILLLGRYLPSSPFDLILVNQCQVAYVHKWNLNFCPLMWAFTRACIRITIQR